MERNIYSWNNFVQINVVIFVSEKLLTPVRGCSRTAPNDSKRLATFFFVRSESSSSLISRLLIFQTPSWGLFWEQVKLLYRACESLALQRWYLVLFQVPQKFSLMLEQKIPPIKYHLEPKKALGEKRRRTIYDLISNELRCKNRNESRNTRNVQIVSWGSTAEHLFIEHESIHFNSDAICTAMSLGSIASIFATNFCRKDLIGLWNLQSPK